MRNRPTPIMLEDEHRKYLQARKHKTGKSFARIIRDLIDSDRQKNAAGESSTAAKEE